ncbi:hypothetical protein RBSWK_02465 [Rhodopirellula baltica SWK14]|uniref:Uncharacterized protein n=1 Tax=Rhodopirellula baltica SWK14 TaxID=993516 RepID=L7CHU0_RHOBT|nr:hypothetical protein RBSWK_02465 [Rhodopirellula baltica SWK14]
MRLATTNKSNENEDQSESSYRVTASESTKKWRRVTHPSPL